MLIIKAPIVGLEECRGFGFRRVGRPHFFPLWWKL